MPNSPDADMYRSDGSIKSARGYLGPMVSLRDGKTMSEFTVGVPIDGANTIS